MKKILAVLLFTLPLWAGNLLEIIALAQSAKLESLKEFNKNEYLLTTFSKFNNNLKYVRVEYSYSEKFFRLYKFAYVFFIKD